jgi:hypothetical protein
MYQSPKVVLSRDRQEEAGLFLVWTEVYNGS